MSLLNAAMYLCMQPRERGGVLGLSEAGRVDHAATPQSAQSVPGDFRSADL